jgi:predicted transcriptional regulator
LPLLAAEVDDMASRTERMPEAAAEQSLCDELRRAVQESGLHANVIAERIGLDAIVFSK